MAALLGEAYDLSIAMDGPAAIRAAATDQPDLILLDIVMPDMDGYEVCRRLKQDPATRAIPVIFVTALTDIGDETKGFSLGAVDYITKPVKAGILMARVKTHLDLKFLHDRLKQSISLLEHEKEILQHKAELGIQARSLAHDMSNILTAGEVVSLIPPMLSDDQPEKQEILEILAITLESLRLGSEICKGYKCYIRGIGEKPSLQDPSALLHLLSIYARQFKGKLIRDIQKDLPQIRCKPDQIKRALVNLFTNAMQAMEMKKEKQIIIRIFHEPPNVLFSVEDTGKGIPDDVLPHIFEEDFTTKENGTGLGLFILKQIVDAHEGSIRIETKEGKGTRFTLAFPAENGSRKPAF